MDAKIKNNSVRGFTLIELLAVIVVLAIIMLIAVNAIIPQTEKARERAFAIEANGVIKSAQQYVIAQGYTNHLVVGTGGICIKLETLVNSGDSELDKSRYSGHVIVKKSGNIFTYQVWLTNQTYMVEGAGVETASGVTSNKTIDTETDVKPYNSGSSTTIANCPTGTGQPIVWPS